VPKQVTAEVTPPLISERAKITTSRVDWVLEIQENHILPFPLPTFCDYIIRYSMQREPHVG
jgi:hypothetical protein